MRAGASSTIISSSADSDQAAGVNVDDVLGQILKAKLANSKCGDEENLRAMIDAFEQKVFLLLGEEMDIDSPQTKRMFDGLRFRCPLSRHGSDSREGIRLTALGTGTYYGF